MAAGEQVGVRLQKLLAQAGIASRRAAERLIVDGRVRVDGVVQRQLGVRAQRHQTIEVSGMGTVHAEPKVYIALHKPEKVISAVTDPEGRMTVTEVIAASRAEGPRQHEGDLPRVYPVGRLDWDAEGLLLCTNDGAMTQTLLHPRFHVPKTYMAKVSDEITPRSLQRLRDGVRLREPNGTLSRRTAPADVEIVPGRGKNTWLEITVVEGRNRQIKRMCEAVGHPVLRLIRTSFAGIALDDLPAGAWRFLTGAEMQLLQQWRRAA